jgi:hypothetical protein
MTHDELLAEIDSYALKESKHPESELSDDHYFYDLGYNQALADVRQAIEKELK